MLPSQQLAPRLYTKGLITVTDSVGQLLQAEKTSPSHRQIDSSVTAQRFNTPQGKLELSQMKAEAADTTCMSSVNPSSTTKEEA